MPEFSSAMRITIRPLPDASLVNALPFTNRASDDNGTVDPFLQARVHLVLDNSSALTISRLLTETFSSSVSRSLVNAIRSDVGLGTLNEKRSSRGRPIVVVPVA